MKPLPIILQVTGWIVLGLLVAYLLTATNDKPAPTPGSTCSWSLPPSEPQSCQYQGYTYPPPGP